MARLDDIKRFYEILAELETVLGGKRVLEDCRGGSLFPLTGMYFFYEPGEERAESGNGLRVVRIGTHAVSRGSKTTLWQRLSQHKGVQRTGGGNHRGSIFRLLLGQSIMRRQPHLHSATWGVGSSASAGIRNLELDLELAVSSYLRKMPFLWLAVEGESSPNNLRSYLERNSIGLLSNLNKEVLDMPSQKWLGLSCPDRVVRECGLWNRNHTDSTHEPKFLDAMEKLGKNQISLEI
jgi:hypothetical protein